MAKNHLFYGDNLTVLREHIADEGVDLVYLDPPFNSNQDYNVLFTERNGSDAAAQIKAFEDTWHWDMNAAAALNDVIENGPGPVARAMRAFRRMLGTNDMLALQQRKDAGSDRARPNRTEKPRCRTSLQTLP